ncbi:MAG: pyridoxamine 5'-phosphate oxidase family protein, partial [Acidimicrobiales bacterium]|nr:pyridoxamine 5'-phosphate oxidase family protein [Acidimicrobiales bacterium]
FLAGLHIGIVSINEPGRGPLAVPVWYDYAPGGEVSFVTPAGSRKAGLLSVGDRMSLCAQDEALPPKYVAVEGEVTEIRPATVEGDVTDMAVRYLGEEIGAIYVQSSRAEDPRDEIVVSFRPERWYSADFAKRLA